jgi:hypothetical protein
MIHTIAGSIPERISPSVNSDSFPDLLSPMMNNRKRTFQRIRLNMTPKGRISLKERPVKFATTTCRRN